MQYTIGADTWQFDLHTLDIFSSATYVPIAYVMPMPAWRTMPKVLLNVYGATTTKTSFEAVIVALRADIFATWLGCPGLSYASSGHGWGITGLTEYCYEAAISVVAMNGVDVMALNVKTAAVTHTILNDQPPSDGLLAGAQVFFAGASGGSVDLDPVVTALQDLAHQTSTVSVNNGAVQVVINSGEIIV